MQMKTFMVMTLLSAAAAGYGLDIQLSDGSILQKVKVTNVSSQGIEVMHKYGGKKILPEMIAESDHPKLKEHILRYKQLIGNKNITNAIQEARRSGSINAAIPILEQAIKSAPEAENIAEAKKILTSLKEKSESNIKAVLIAVANEKELSAAIEIMEKAVAENPFAENLEQAKDKLAELKKKRVDFEDHRIETAIQKAETAAYGFDRKIAILREAIARNKNASKLPEAKNLLDKFTELRRQEQRRLAEAIRKTEEKRRAEARRKAEERQRRFAEERRRAEEKRRAEARRKAEEERLVAEKRRAETERFIEANREVLAQCQRLAEEKAKAEQSFFSKVHRSLANAKRNAEAGGLPEKKRLSEAEAVCKAEENRLADMTRDVEIQRRRLAEAEAKCKAEENRLADMTREVAEQRLRLSEAEKQRRRLSEAYLDAKENGIAAGDIIFECSSTHDRQLVMFQYSEETARAFERFVVALSKGNIGEGIKASKHLSELLKRLSPVHAAAFSNRLTIQNVKPGHYAVLVIEPSTTRAWWRDIKKSDGHGLQYRF